MTDNKKIYAGCVIKFKKDDRKSMESQIIYVLKDVFVPAAWNKSGEMIRPAFTKQILVKDKIINHRYHHHTRSR